MSIDLHLHTYHSDGKWSPEQLVEKAIELKLQTIAVTDHDTMDGVTPARAFAAGRIEIIPGIEINTIWKDADGHVEDVHILGYFLEAANGELTSLLQRQQDARLKLVDDTIEKLSAAGINLTLADIQGNAGKGSIGRPHITQALAAKGYASDPQDAYDRFMLRSSPYYVVRESVSPYEAIAAICAAGGVASIAHPGKTPRIEKIIGQLKVAGLGAIECYHRRHSLDMVKHYLRLAHDNGLAITGGSDCHGPRDGYHASIGSISVPAEILPSLRQRASNQTTNNAQATAAIRG